MHACRRISTQNNVIRNGGTLKKHDGGNQELPPEKWELKTRGKVSYTTELAHTQG